MAGQQLTTVNKVFGEVMNHLTLQPMLNKTVRVQGPYWITMGHHYSDFPTKHQSNYHTKYSTEPKSLGVLGLNTLYSAHSFKYSEALSGITQLGLIHSSLTTWWLSTHLFMASLGPIPSHTRSHSLPQLSGRRLSIIGKEVAADSFLFTVKSRVQAFSTKAIKPSVPLLHHTVTIPAAPTN